MLDSEQARIINHTLESSSQNMFLQCLSKKHGALNQTIQWTSKSNYSTPAILQLLEGVTKIDIPINFTLQEGVLDVS